MTLLDDLQTTITGVAERLRPSIVGLGRGWGAGSGVVVGDGQGATVAHAVRREAPAVPSADGRRAEATIAGGDRDANVAVLTVDTGDAPPVELASERPGLGGAVVALADPGGRGLRASLGFVTVAERGMRGPRGRRLSGAIEHSAPLPPARALCGPAPAPPPSTPPPPPAAPRAPRSPTPRAASSASTPSAWRAG